MALQLKGGSLLKESGSLGAYANCCCPGLCSCDPDSGAPFSSIQITIAGVTCCCKSRGSCQSGCPTCTWMNATFDLTLDSGDCNYIWTEGTVYNDCPGPGCGGCCSATRQIKMGIGTSVRCVVQLDYPLGFPTIWLSEYGELCYPTDSIVGEAEGTMCGSSLCATHTIPSFYGYGGTVTLDSVTP